MFQKDEDCDREFILKKELFVFDSYCNSPFPSFKDEESDYYFPINIPIYPIKKEIIVQEPGKRVEEEKNEETEKIGISSQIKKPSATAPENIPTQQVEEKKKQIIQIKKPIQKKEVHMLPGESKNIPKNYTRTLKQFIISNFDSSVLQNPDIKKFLATKPEKACKQTLENSLRNCQQLKQISQIFFGNLQWGKIFLEENKVELEPYFRFNSIWFGSKN